MQKYILLFRNYFKTNYFISNDNRLLGRWNTNNSDKNMIWSTYDNCYNNMTFSIKTTSKKRN